MHLTVFNVEHGACALLDCDNGTQIMIDAGHNASNGWRPGDHLVGQDRRNLQQLIITNYDEDHVSGLPNLVARSTIGWLMRNVSVSPQTIRQLKSEDGMGTGIDMLVRLIEQQFSSPPQNALAIPNLPNYGPNVSLQVFSNAYPDFDDENNLSLVVHLVCNGVGVMFTGDMEAAGWEYLLSRNAAACDALRRTDIFIAPHHGRKSGCCDRVFDFCKPALIVVSDKSHMHDSQQTTDYYAAKTTRAIFRGDRRKVVSTRSDGNLRFTFFPGAKWTGD